MVGRPAGGYDEVGSTIRSENAMQIPVLIEPLPDGRGFRARAIEPFQVAAESVDRSAAIDAVRRRLDELVNSGQVVAVNVGSATPFVGDSWAIDMKDPRYQEWWQYVEEFRRECDNVTFPGEGPDDPE
jgi:hypothetical protein